MVEHKVRGGINTPANLKAWGYVSIVGLAGRVDSRTARMMRNIVSMSKTYNAVCLADSNGANPKFWYPTSQVDDLIRYVKTGTPAQQGELFPASQPEPAKVEEASAGATTSPEQAPAQAEQAPVEQSVPEGTDGESPSLS